MLRHNERLYDTIPERPFRKREVKRFLCIACVIGLISPIFFGCGDTSGINVTDDIGGQSQEVRGTSETHRRSGKPVVAPVDILYTVENNLEIISEEITNEGDENQEFKYHHVVISISGLKDKQVEKKINDRIWEVYESLKSQGLPPFRGIKAVIPEDAQLVSDSIYSYVTANYNNVLSVCINRDSSYRPTSEERGNVRTQEGYYRDTGHVYVMEGLTFDLNTGNEITLADVFADNVDYLALLNNAVMKDLNEVSAQDEGYFTRWHGLKLAESFKGLSPDQKFFLDAYGINLIFDYDTPEFYLSDFMAQTIHIPYENLNRSVAIMKRFYDEREKIFTSEDEEVKSLIYSGYTNIPIQKQEYADGYIYVYNYTKVSPNFPESLMEKVMAMSSVPQAKIHEMNQYVMNERAHWNEEVNGYFEQHVNAGTVGHYAIVTKNINGATRDTGFFSNECKTYDLKSGREMALAEMFVDGFDYKSLVRKTFEKTIADRGGLYQEGRKMSEEEIRELLDEILSGNPGFCPYPNSIHIVAGDAEFAGGYREPLQISLDFEEIEYENLAVFDSR